jgi:hypothetical protein
VIPLTLLGAVRIYFSTDLLLVELSLVPLAISLRKQPPANLDLALNDIYRLASNVGAPPLHNKSTIIVTVSDTLSYSVDQDERAKAPIQSHKITTTTVCESYDGYYGL